MADTSTVVGETILVKGNLEGDEDLTVQGRIEGSINLSKTLIVEPSGVVKADISVSNAIISGVIVGNLSASDSVEITDSGRMVGDIQAPRVIIVEGALFKGKVDMGDLEMPRPTGSPVKSSYTPSPMPSKRPEPARPAPVAKKPPPPKKVERKAPAPSKSAGRSTKKKVVVKKKKR